MRIHRINLQHRSMLSESHNGTFMVKRCRRQKQQQQQRVNINTNKKYFTKHIEKEWQNLSLLRASLVHFPQRKHQQTSSNSADKYTSDELATLLYRMHIAGPRRCH